MVNQEQFARPRIERQLQPAPVQRQEVRLPDVGEYHAVYGRLFLSVVAVDPKRRHEPLDHKLKFSKIGFPENSLKKQRDYSAITWGLSKSERKKAWEDVIHDDQSFEAAKSEWKQSLLRQITTTTDVERIEFIKDFTGKDASEFTDQDIEDLYQAYCEGKSDTTAFVEKSSKIAGKKKQKEWLAKRFFGRDSASVVVLTDDLETGITNHGLKRTMDVLYANFQRVNSPNPREKYLLGKLYDKFEELPIAQPIPQPPKPAASPAPAVTTEEEYAANFAGLSKAEKMRILHEAMDKIKRNQRPEDPKTGKPLMVPTKEHAISYIRQLMQEVSREAEPKPAAPLQPAPTPEPEAKKTEDERPAPVKPELTGPVAPQGVPEPAAPVAEPVPEPTAEAPLPVVEKSIDMGNYIWKGKAVNVRKHPINEDEIKFFGDDNEYLGSATREQFDDLVKRGIFKPVEDNLSNEEPSRVGIGEEKEDEEDGKLAPVQPQPEPVQPPPGTGAKPSIDQPRANLVPETAEPQAIKVKEVDLKESENIIEDLTRELSSETGEYDKKEFIITPRQFADELIGAAAKIQIKKGSGEIIINPKHPTILRIRGYELESGAVLNLRAANIGKNIRLVKIGKTRGSVVKLPEGKLPDYEFYKFGTNLKRLLNLLSEAWKSDRVHIADGNFELDFNLK